ncbi:hypothetical protein RchiOBHm_Chr5g0033641 [Rosa chinensis]|uniref:Uncharacterized protein n=1 Tax=Rosa chinensis TaxID=74649 RepID=A0A2P6QAR2_ROSCH|nr:hypothetical protein RchiOBHm_Chr5g0033641 [Rosa chinensis]
MHKTQVNEPNKECIHHLQKSTVSDWQQSWIFFFSLFFWIQNYNVEIDIKRSNLQCR